MIYVKASFQYQSHGISHYMKRLKESNKTTEKLGGGELTLLKAEDVALNLIF